MTKSLVTALLFLVATTLFAQQRILIISTNIDSVANHRSGTYLPEIAYAFKNFIDKGYAVDVVTPSGGKASIYHEATIDADLASIRDSKSFLDKTENTLEPSGVDPTKYRAVYVPGGHGQFFDVATDERIATIIAKIYEAGGVIGTAGHGMASIVNVKLSNCTFLVSRKRITTYPAWAEGKWMSISNYGKALPFCLQEVLQRRGAYIVMTEPEINDNTDHTKVIDKANRIVSGTYASSAGWVSEEMIKMF